mmetsp:Transcript_14457/g.15620  ORF Transcript_14457/g.15620 Transcript_14457/m.15620 type:complete len:109 (-) Transcript_14457:41-367(-)
MQHVTPKISHVVFQVNVSLKVLNIPNVYPMLLMVTPINNLFEMDDSFDDEIKTTTTTTNKNNKERKITNKNNIEQKTTNKNNIERKTTNKNAHSTHLCIFIFKCKINL